MSGGPRIVLFTLDDRQFAPLLLGPVLERWRSSIAAVYVSRTLFNLRFLRKRAGFLLRNRYPFCVHPGDLWRFARKRLRGAGGPGRPRSMMDYLAGQGVPAQYIDEIRSPAALEKLRALQADIFLFCPFDKIAPPEFLEIPRLGTFNVHMGKLPEHRGGLSAFWVLRFGDTEAGMTVHRAVPQLDAGEIVEELRFPVQTSSMQALMEETFTRGGQTVASALAKIAGGYQPVSVEGRPSGYHLIPARQDFQAFYDRGCRLI